MRYAGAYQVSMPTRPLRLTHHSKEVTARMTELFGCACLRSWHIRKDVLTLTVLWSSDRQLHACQSVLERLSWFWDEIALASLSSSAKTSSCLWAISAKDRTVASTSKSPLTRVLKYFLLPYFSSHSGATSALVCLVYHRSAYARVLIWSDPVLVPM